MVRGMSPISPASPYRVTACNLAAESENRIHADDVARRYGFEGGLVAGITTYAYLTRPVVEHWGEAWLARGTFRVRLLHPVYDAETIDVVSRPAAGSDQVLEVEARNAAGRVCAGATATLPDEPADAPDPASWPEAPLPAPEERPPESIETMRGLGTLGSVARTFRAERAPEFLGAIGDEFALYGAGGPAHPGWIVYDANQILFRNVALGPWIHTATEATHFSTVHDGDVVTTAGRVADVYERKGHQMVDLDLLVTADRTRPVWHLRHTAIFEIARTDS